MFHGRVDGDDKIHLSTVFVRQQKQPMNVFVRDFVVKGLAVQVDKVHEKFHIVTTARRYTIQLGERANSIGVRGALHVRLGENLLYELLRRIDVGRVVQISRQMKSNLHQAHGRVFVLVKLQYGLVLGHIRVGHIFKRYFKGRLAVYIKQHRIAHKIRLAPIPALHRQVRLFHMLMNGSIEVVVQFLKVILAEAVESMHAAVFEHYLETIAARSLQPVQIFNVMVLYLLRFARFFIFKHTCTWLYFQMSLMLQKKTIIHLY